MNWFIDEQIEEEESARDMIFTVEAVENDKYGMYMLDKELATRVYNVPSPLATAE
jgi:ferritin